MSQSLTKKYRVVVDQNMPGVEELFGDIADIIYQDGRLIDNDILMNADALLCRSITQVGQALLKNTKVKFVGTATIGIDHLDIDWLESNHITWSNAAGCNAAAVAQYVLSAMAYWCQFRSRQIEKLCVGIVGAGNVGSELARCLDKLDIKYLLCDPPLQLLGDKRPMVSMQEIYQCDVISLHVPMIETGDYPTKYLIGKRELECFRDDQLLINASRGAVINNQALEASLLQNPRMDAVLDVFENEPNISNELVNKCLLTTPHIAGHTLEGKLRGTWMVYQAFCKCFEMELGKIEDDLYPQKNKTSLSHNLEDNLLAIYDILSDSNALSLKNEEPIDIKFDRLRKNATQLANGCFRRDYSGWSYLGEYSLPL